MLVDTLFDQTLTAEMLEAMRRATPAASRIGTVVNTHGNGDHCYGNAVFAPFDLAGVELTLPNRTFQGELELQVGDKRVLLIEVGPAHTRGDAVVWIPADKTLFTGDREPADVLALFAGMARLQRN